MQVLIRRLTFAANVLLLSDLLIGAVHKRGRCLHDLFAGTVVVVTDGTKVE
jgi:uncharacterized RDD family membrane protein YckC